MYQIVREKRMDRRQQKTEKLILDSFTQLLMKKNFAHITVKEIIDTANIGRSTFYNHYETKEQLLQSLCVHLFEHVFQKYTKEADQKTNALQITTHILYHLKDDQNVLAHLLVSESSDLMIYYFKKYILSFTDESFFDAYLQQNNEVPKDYLQNHVVTSFIGMVQWWILKGMKESPETMAQYFVYTMSHSLI